MYKPIGSSALSEVKINPQIRLGIQGQPGTGKTWASLTFPNPIVLNLDRGLGAHIGRSDIIEVPFYDPRFVDSIFPRSGSTSPPNRRDAILKWLSTEGMKLSQEQTLIIDSNTQLQNSFHTEYKINPVYTKTGKIDDYAEWNQKVTYFGEVMEYLKMIPCNVVYIAHETADRDKAGELNGMVRPLLTGQFADQLASHFTDYFRCHSFAKPQIDKLEQFKTFFKLTDTKEFLESGSNSTIYVFQTQSDEIARHCKTSTMVNSPKFILANYQSIIKYRKTK